MINLRFVFLLLNYNNFDDTVQCISSIKNLDYGLFEIVVVDNGSTDNSAYLLAEKYRNDSEIHLIELPKNVGFSAGNNYGYKYIRENLHCDFIVVSNNDIIFEQKDFLGRVINLYKSHDFYLCGPDIIVKDSHEHQSPITYKLPTIEDVKKELKMYEFYMDNPKKWVRRRKLQIRKNILCQKFKLIGCLYAKKKHRDLIDYKSFRTECCLQGACIIVSKNFIQNEEKIFSPETFLYCEELILYKKCIDNEYKIIYSPEIYVLHNDSSTMKKITKNAYDKAVFTLKHHVEARKILLRVISNKSDE